ncbi:ATP-binding cassette domain-containing protein [Gordonia paraffinivorans]|uniref:ATP-binding cassette domain-containing protein n=1 Tax=Gordonia paraffinivorans TaxID=175628 RepID=UPI0035E3ED16
MAGGQQSSDAIRQPRHRRPDEETSGDNWSSPEVWDAETDAVAAKLREWRLENERRRPADLLTDAADQANFEAAGSAESEATHGQGPSYAPDQGQVRPGAQAAYPAHSTPAAGNSIPEGRFPSNWFGGDDGTALSATSERHGPSEPAARVKAGDADSEDRVPGPYHGVGTNASLSDAERPSVPDNSGEAQERMSDAGRSSHVSIPSIASSEDDDVNVAASRSGGTERELAIHAVNLQKRFKNTVAVQDVSLSVPAGSIVALLGPNGAGKTTTVNMLCTLLRPDGGSAMVNGHDVVRDAPAVRRSIMLTGQFAALDESLTGRENLVLFGRLLGLSKADAKKRADELLEIFALTDAANKRVGQYSGGMRRRIDIACGLVTSPKVVFLDEPTTGLDPRSRQEVWTLVERLRDEGVTILLTTQYLEEADILSDRIVVIDNGRVIAEGTADELKEATGAAYCEVTPADHGDLARLVEVLSDLIPGESVHTDDHTVAVPAPLGTETLVEVIRRTADADIPLSDVAMRRPSLDEVFLALTDPDRNGR